MNKYEAMIIFSDSIEESDLEGAIGRVRSEMEKFDGVIDSTTRLGKREFARVLQKKTSGHYVLITLEMDGQNIDPLLARLKLNEEVFRTQIVCAGAQPAQEERVEEAQEVS